MHALALGLALLCPQDAPVRGVLLDDATGQPVADVQLELRRGVSKHACVVAADGSFQSEADVRPGTLKLRPHLGDGTRVRADPDEFVHSGARKVPHEVRLRIGPAFQVLLEKAQDDPRSWRARWVLVRGSAESPGPWRPIEDSRVRFAEPLPDLANRSEVLLEVEDRGGTLLGRAPLPVWVGEVEEPIALAVRALGRIQGQVVDGAGNGVAGCQVYWIQAGDTPPPLWEAGGWQRLRMDDDGTLAVPRLDPGRYHVRVVPPDRPVIDRTVEVRAGAVDLDLLVVTRSPPTHRVEGQLVSAGGRNTLSVMLDLRSEDGFVQRTWLSGSPVLGGLWFQRPDWSADLPEGLADEIAFQFDDVPPGRYSLRVVTWDGWRYEDTPRTLEVPGPPVVLRRLDEEDRRAWIGFAVRDARTGAELPEYLARFRTSLWQKPRWSLPDHAAWPSGELLGQFDPAADLEWAIWAEGYVPQYGDLARFEALIGDERLLPLGLERGWGARLTIRDARDPRREFRAARVATSLLTLRSAPLAGVRVLADGEPVGVTNAAGQVDLVLAREPQRLTFEKAGWLPVPSPCWAEGALATGVRTPDLWMVPREE